LEEEFERSLFLPLLLEPMLPLFPGEANFDCAFEDLRMPCGEEKSPEVEFKGRRAKAGE